MKKLEKVYLALIIICTLFCAFVGITGGPISSAAIVYIPVIVTYLFAWLIRNTIEERKSKKFEMAKNKSNETITEQQTYNDTKGNVLYMGMNGKPVTLWKFIIGAILLIGGTILAISAVL